MHGAILLRDGYSAVLVLAQKRILPFLSPDGGNRAVTGEDAGVGWERKKLGFDSLDQKRVTSARKVGSANGILKKDIPPHKDG